MFDAGWTSSFPTFKGVMRDNVTGQILKVSAAADPTKYDYDEAAAPPESSPLPGDDTYNEAAMKAMNIIDIGATIVNGILRRVIPFALECKRLGFRGG